MFTLPYPCWVVRDRWTDEVVAIDCEKVNAALWINSHTYPEQYQLDLEEGVVNPLPCTPINI